MPGDQLSQDRPILIDERVEIDHARVEALPEVSRLVEHVRDAAAHARGEIAARLAEHDDPAARHVFAAMVAYALDDGPRAAVPHGKPFAGHSAQIDLAARRAIQRDVADDDVLFGHERGLDDGNTARVPPDSPLPT